jgi:uncharacterized protein
VVDIETSPHILYGFGLFNQNFGISQIEEPTRMLCFAAQWTDEKQVIFYSEYHNSHEEMVQAAWDLLNEADAVITYNGNSFDIPHLNREFLLAGLTPPAPYASIDLYRTVRKQFKNASNKLDWVAQQLGVGSKVRHSGFQLWLDCLKGDPKAWEDMKRYNIGDIKITLAVYKKILPWIVAHPSVPMFEGHREGCPNCGSMKAAKEGYSYTASSKFQRFRCTNPKCGKWYRGSTRLSTPEARGL